MRSELVRRAQLGILAICVLALIASVATAQVVHLQNHGAKPFVGWHRLNVDVRPSAPAGWRFSPTPPMQAATPITGAGRSGEVEVEYVRGRQTGLDTWAVDVWCRLAPGQRIDVDLATLDDHERPVPNLPNDVLGFFGDLPIVNGARMLPTSLAVDGAGISVHFRGRVPNTRMLVLDLWTTWYPGQPWCQGEAKVTASNSTVSDLTETTTADVVLSFGDAVVFVLGASTPGRLVAAGVKFGDGQARAIPITFLWLRHLNPASWVTQLDSCLSDQARAIGGVGISRMLFDGNPRSAPGFDAAAWANAILPETFARIHDWRAGTTGPNPRSSDTGAQTGNQTFVGVEDVAGEGGVPGAEVVRYLGALKQAGRPSNHLEPDGSPLDPSRHVSPRLVLWDGRAHYNAGVSPDQLGKPRALNWDPVKFETYPDLRESSGWWGPDSQHHLCNTLAAACRLTGSPACQSILRANAVIYRLQLTTAAGLSTSTFDSARTVGWEGILAVHCWRALEDRAEAERVRAHWLARWSTVLRPALWGRDVWDPRVDDPRLGAGSWWSPWQQALGAYGLDLAGRVFNAPEASACAMQAARTVLDRAIGQEAGKWRTYSAVRTDFSERFTGVDSNIFWLFGTPCAVWLLRGEPAADAVWSQMLTDATQQFQAQWLPAGTR